MKYFKGDATEIKMDAAGAVILDSINLSLDAFYEDAYNCVPMGELLYDEQRIPLASAIDREIFIRCFREILEAWAACGTFESYILVFSKIFGEGSTVEFTVPGPGKLNIDITATGFDEDQFIAREIVDNQYVYYDMIDDVGDNIIFTSVLGIESQYDLEKALFTMVPNGIYTEISVSFA